MPPHEGPSHPPSDTPLHYSHYANASTDTGEGCQLEQSSLHVLPFSEVQSVISIHSTSPHHNITAKLISLHSTSCHYTTTAKANTQVLYTDMYTGHVHRSCNLTWHTETHCYCILRKLVPQRLPSSAREVGLPQD